MPTREQTISIVIPCYNEEEVITETVHRLTAICASIDHADIELIFVDDGSKDNTREILKACAENDPRIRIIGFSRNFGHQLAITAGIDAATGDAVVLIDADLQDPPEVILRMIAKWRDGYDVVYGTRSERLGESRFKKTSARLFYKILNAMSDIPIPLDTGDFRLMDRAVADTLRAMPERDRFVRGMVSWAGLRQTAILYQRAERFAGSTKYPLRKMLHFALNGIFSFSTKPLQLSTTFCVLCALLAFFGILYTLFMRLFTNIWVEGWTALMLAILFIGGVQLISTGILGEYVGRIYNETKKRPLYIVHEYIGFPPDDSIIRRTSTQSKSRL